MMAELRGTIETRTPRQLNEALQDHPYPMCVEAGVPSGYLTITITPWLKIVHHGPLGDADGLVCDPLVWLRTRERASQRGAGDRLVTTKE